MLLRTNDVFRAQLGLGFPHAASWQVAAKRILDDVGSITLLILLMPLFLVIAFLVRVSSPGPVLFRWNVVGQGGRPFVGYKFRTMLVAADRMREQLRDKNEMTG